MKKTKLFVVGMIAILTVLLALAVSAQKKNQNDIDDLRERDEIRQTVRLASDARVEVSSIRGSVEIETANIEVAEIEIVRSAENRKDLEQFKIEIENTPQSLIIRGQKRERNSGYAMTPDVRHRVKLRLPERVNLFINSVSGNVRIGDVSGQIEAKSVSGSVSVGEVNDRILVNGVSGNLNIGRAKDRVEIKSVSGNVGIAQIADSLDVQGVSGRLTVNIAKLGADGINISTVSGGVELHLRSDINTGLRAENIGGTFEVEIPGTKTQSSQNVINKSIVIGKGGSLISVRSVTGGLLLVQDS